MAFRAVRDGDLKVMRELAFEQPGLLHDRFTDAMEDWELEFESPKWYQFRDATCLFIACAYARREAVEFLLEFGADRDDKCYMSQRPIDVVGMCRENEMDESYITTILSRPKQPPRAPREPKTTCKLCLEELSHIERYDVPDPDGGAPQQKTRRVSETVARAKVTLDWATEWLKSTLEYELKYRAVNDYDGRSDEKWKTEVLRCTAKALAGLLPDTLYAFEVRARNDVGYGDLAPRTFVQTPSAASILAKKS